MTDDGYTLAEMLVALVIIGLTIGGMTQGVHAIGRLQGMTGRVLADGRNFNRVGVGLDQLVEDRGPYSSTPSSLFYGVASGFSFACDNPAPCGAVLTPAKGGVDLRVVEPDGSSRVFALPGVQSAHFTYAGTRTYGPVWPAASPEPQTLRTIGLVATTADGGDAPIASVRLWPEQGLDCEFDAITRVCRGQTG
jgi:prepilin-type N-terminal cleavage/methylation domain-containing protein